MKAKATPWIGVDLDGTLAHYEHWTGGGIGKPIPAMVERVKAWLKAGKDVRIITARVSGVGRLGGETVEDQRVAIHAWCVEHIGFRLPICCCKDYGMTELWDDLAVRVVANTGQPCCDEHTVRLAKREAILLENFLRQLAPDADSADAMQLVNFADTLRKVIGAKP